MEPTELIWEGRIGGTPLRVGVPHAGRIVAEWDAPEGPRHKVAESVEQFERTVLFQLLLKSGESGDATTDEVITAIRKAEIERPARVPDPSSQRRRKNPKVRQHRRSRRPPRRR